MIIFSFFDFHYPKSFFNVVLINVVHSSTETCYLVLQQRRTPVKSTAGIAKKIMPPLDTDGKPLERRIKWKIQKVSRRLKVHHWEEMLRSRARGGMEWQTTDEYLAGASLCDRKCLLGR